LYTFNTLAMHQIYKKKSHPFGWLLLAYVL